MVVRVTDKQLLRWRLTRAHRRGETRATFLLDIAVRDLAERLVLVERRFELAVAHGGQTGALAEALAASGKVGRVLRIEHTAAALAKRAGPGIVADEEALPLAPGSIDLFASTLALQWTNDLPGALLQIRQALRPDGLLLATMMGGRTLGELREALAAAESEVGGGVSPRVLPMADIRDLGALLQRAGFALPVADRDLIVARYDSALELMRDLRSMGAANTLAERHRGPASRRLFLRAAEIHAERFSEPDGRVVATFEMISLSGWAPHESQQQAAQRGSASISLASVLPDRGRRP